MPLLYVITELFTSKYSDSSCSNSVIVVEPEVKVEETLGKTIQVGKFLLRLDYKLEEYKYKYKKGELESTKVYLRSL